MKKVIITFIMLATAIVVGNAQFFVEGSIGVRYDSEELDGRVFSETTSSSVSFLPQVGYWLNDNIAIGLRVTLSKENTKRKTINPNSPESNLDATTSRWRVSAFSRYKLWGTEKFSLLFDGSLYYERRNEIASIKRETSVVNSLNPVSRVGIHVFPAISYDLSERFSIIATSHFLSMEYYSENGKTENTYTDNGSTRTSTSKERTKRFVFGTSSTIFNSLGSIRIGFIYNF